MSGSRPEKVIEARIMLVRFLSSKTAVILWLTAKVVFKVVPENRNSGFAAV